MSAPAARPAPTVPTETLAPLSAEDRRWVAFVRGDDRIGTLTALTSVFSTRGVSFDSLSTGDVAEGVGLIVVVFSASERRQRMLTRTVRRLAGVRSVQVRAASDPAVRAAAVVLLPSTEAGYTPPADAAVRWTGDPAAGQPVLLEGPLADVERVLEHARERGAVRAATAVLPPRDPEEDA